MRVWPIKVLDHKKNNVVESICDNDRHNTSRNGSNNESVTLGRRSTLPALMNNAVGSVGVKYPVVALMISALNIIAVSSDQDIASVVESIVVHDRG